MTRVKFKNGNQFNTTVKQDKLSAEYPKQPKLNIPSVNKNPKVTVHNAGEITGHVSVSEIEQKKLEKVSLTKDGRLVFKYGCNGGAGKLSEEDWNKLVADIEKMIKENQLSAATKEYVDKKIQEIITAGDTVPDYIKSQLRQLGFLTSELQSDLGNLTNSTNDAVRSLQNKDKEIEEKQKQIKDEQSITNSTFHTQIEQNSRSITQQAGYITDNSQEITTLKQTAAGITSTVKANKTYQDGVNKDVNTAVKNVRDRVTITEEDINVIQQNAKGLTSTVESNKRIQDKVNSDQAAINTTVRSDISQIKQTASEISTTVRNNMTVTNSKFQQMSDQMNFMVDKRGVIASINLSPEGVKIAGKRLQIDGDVIIRAENLANNSVTSTKIVGGAITTDKIATNAITADHITAGAVTANKIAAKAITADKLNVDKLSAIASDIGTLNGGTITGTKIIGTNFKNTSGSFTVDNNGVIKGAHIVSGSIDADIIRRAGFGVSASSIRIGEISMVADGRQEYWFTIPCPDGYVVRQCLPFVSNNYGGIVGGVSFSERDEWSFNIIVRDGGYTYYSECTGTHFVPALEKNVRYVFNYRVLGVK